MMRKKINGWTVGSAPEKSGQYSILYRRDDGTYETSDYVGYSKKWNKWNFYDWMDPEHEEHSWDGEVIAYIPYRDNVDRLVKKLVKVEEHENG